MEREKRRVKPTHINPLDLGGKLPPQARELEEAVLGAMMLEKEKITEVIEILSVDHFYVEQNKYVFRAIQEMFAEGESIDLLTVTQKLRNTGNLELAGGSYYLAQLTNRVTSGAHVEYHARILTQKFIQRELIRVSGEISREAFEDVTDAFKLLDESERSLYDIKNRSLKKGFSSISTLLHKAINDIQNKEKNEGGLTGIATGFSNLDRITSGFQRSDLIIVAARPGMGKTAFALSVARNAAVNFGKSVAIFSLEMQDLQLVNRLISAEAEIASDRIRSASLNDEEWRRLHQRTVRLDNAKIYLDDTPQLSVFDLKAKCRRMHSQHGLDMVVIDYLQLMRADDKNINNREQEISHISRSLKGLAKELDVPVIALAQLSREVEKRQIKRPMLSDLRESGSIEQDADLVMFLYRDEYYGNQQDEAGNSVQGLCEIILAKHRHGETGTAPARFVAQYSKFEDATDNLMGGGGYDNSGIMTFSSRMNDDTSDGGAMIVEDSPF